MRCALTVIFSATLLATLGVPAQSAPPAKRSQQGPILLELNAPLLLQPIDDELDEQAAASDQPEEVIPNDEATSDEDGKLEADEKSTASVAKSAGVDEKAKDAESKASESSPTAKPADEPPPRPELSEEMKALRVAVRRTIAGYYAQPLNTRDNTPTNVLAACMAFGCEAQVLRDSPSGQKVNAFTCLCCNYPCAGRGLLRIADGQIMADVGYGTQEYPAQFLAALGLSRVPADYSLRVGDDVRKVSDLVQYEQRSCRSGEETSFRLIGLARYLPSDAVWQNDLGETWSISRLIKEELDRPADAAPAGGTFRLLALGYAVDRRVKRDEPIDGEFARAKKYLAKLTKYALDLQNDDGSWHPEFFTYRGQGGSTVDQLRSTGHILRWLAFSLPEERLQDPRVVRSVGFLANGLDTRRYRGYFFATSSREIAARLGAVQALMIYNERLFAPYDEAEKAKAAEEKTIESVAAKTAERS